VKLDTLAVALLIAAAAVVLLSFAEPHLLGSGQQGAAGAPTLVVPEGEEVTSREVTSIGEVREVTSTRTVTVTVSTTEAVTFTVTATVRAASGSLCTNGTVTVYRNVTVERTVLVTKTVPSTLLTTSTVTVTRCPKSSRTPIESAQQRTVSEQPEHRTVTTKCGKIVVNGVTAICIRGWYTVYSTATEVNTLAIGGMTTTYTVTYMTTSSATCLGDTLTRAAVNGCVVIAGTGR